MGEGKVSSESSEHLAGQGPDSKEHRPGRTWSSWVISIIAAIALSVTATLLLGGGTAFRPESVTAASDGGCGGGCCGTEEK